MLNYNEITPKKVVVHEDEPWLVIDSQVSRKQQNKPVNRTKMKNLISGRTLEYTFHVSDKVNEADIRYKDITYLYENEKKGEVWFSDAENPKDRFTLEHELIGNEIRFIKEKSDIEAMIWANKEGEEKVIGLKYPQKVELEVTEAPPGIKGDTATGGTKTVILETGAVCNTPLFVEVGDTISVRTEDGSYSERVSKK